ncbi:hypothetical protein TCSYLVIO_000310 [Trypanosoma cruzi]|nr:hypothetical protein TCSYLVIO_000310 [Trypanosoma cruzi]
MEREGEGRSAAETARKRADKMRRGQQAQPHSAHTTRRHPRKEGTQLQQPPTMQEEKGTTATASSLIPRTTRYGHSPAANTQCTRASEPSSIHHAATNYLPIPPSVGHGAQLNAVTRGASHPQERRLGLRTPSLLMATEEGKSRHTQLPACTTKEAFISTAMCTLCVWLCVPAETQGKEVKKRKQSTWRDAIKCAAEVRGRNNRNKIAQTHDCAAAQEAAIHTILIENKQQKTFPFILYKPHHTK